METAEYQNIADHEEKHFYYVAVHDLILHFIEEFSNPSDKLEILDAGCGTGSLAKKLEKYGRVTGVDVAPEALRISAERGVHIVDSSVESMPFTNNHFDMAVSVDVIYHQHVRDDLRALQEISRVLKDGGLFVIRVPANPRLFSNHDRCVQSARRYTEIELREKLIASQFEILRITHCQWGLFFPAWVKARLDDGNPVDQQRGKSAIGETNPIINEAMKAFCGVEKSLISAGINCPLGIGILAVARKRV